jgi:hypothetical protein
MRKSLLFLAGILMSCCLYAKSVYIPTYWANDTYLKTWSYSRSYQSANFIIFWGSAAGTNPAGNASGSSLHFVPQTICDTLEKIYAKYVTQLKFCSDTSTVNLGKYKIPIVMTNTWGTGGPDDFAYATSFDNVIGGMFVDASATLDGGVTSHEFTHCLQFMMGIQENVNSGGAFQNNDLCGFFFETHANFMRAQLYPNVASYDLPRWIGTGAFHWSSTRHHYDAFDLLFYMQQIDGISMVNRLWKESLADEHPLMTYKRLKGWTQMQLNNFIYDYAKRQVTYDYTVNNVGAILRAERDRLKAQEPHYLWRQYTMLKQISTTTGRYIVPDASAPQDYGFNVIPLYTTCTGKNVTIKFKGHTEVNSTAGWMYGFVATKADGTVSRYGAVNTANESELSFQLNSTETQLYLVVIGAPSTHTSYIWEAGFPRIKRYPYELRIANAVPEGFQTGFRSEYKTNGHAHSNGGGWVANTSTVASTAYVGPNALVLGNSNISGNAVINGTAWVQDAIVTDNVVINGNANVTQGTYGGSTSITDNAILNNVTSSGSAIFKQNALEFGGTFGGTVIVGGDAEVVGCTTGVYLQSPDPHIGNQRTDCDGKGASDITNTDVNSTYTQFTDAQMAFSTTPNCNGAPIAGKMYQIINKNSSKSLGIQNGSTANNAILVQATYQAALYQKFVVDTVGGGSYYKLTPQHTTGKVLDVSGKSTADGASIIQYTWNSTSQNQQWTFVDAGSGYFNIKSRSSGKCLGVESSGTGDNVAVKQYTCSTTAANQLFLFSQVTTTSAARLMQEEVSTTENALVVYPNPASTTFTVVVNAFAPNEDVSLSIYNLQGTLVIKRDIKDQRKINFISESALKNGVYFIRASGVAKSYVQRLAIVQ